MKPGYLTTEFWLTILMYLMAIAVLLVSEFGAESSTVGRIVAGVIAILSGLGYTVPRAGVKKRALEAETARALEAIRETNPS